jgi:hypothetical protein
VLAVPAVGEPHPHRAAGLPLEPRELRLEPDHVVQAGQQHRAQQRPVDLPAGPRRALGGRE